MLKQLRLTNIKSTLSLATRGCIASQYIPIASTATIWQNGNSLPTFKSKNSPITAISFRCYSLKGIGTNSLGDDKFEQTIPTSHSIKSFKSSNYTSDASIEEESNKGNPQKLLNPKKVTLKKLKWHKKPTNPARIKAPTFPYNSFQLYTKFEFSKIKEDSLDCSQFLSNQEIFKIISANWKLMAEAEKLEFEQKFKLLREQFITELHEWWDNVDKNLVQLENLRRSKVNKIRKHKGLNASSMLVDPRAPKRPASAIAMFAKDLKKLNNPDTPFRYIDFSKSVIAKWKELPESEKEIYRYKFKDSFKLYKEVLKKFK
ncbi:hypothetical protein BB561_000283 [Smittium simulii]|uniref:HMG box domain-containing protein n=1 Tax=Smittium simulii TaxID=133385 RepID=A0A2T9YZS0_9FUNG|nr:hypothetical protein BB561_000283 [Smittium simulii]